MTAILTNAAGEIIGRVPLDEPESGPAMSELIRQCAGLVTITIEQDGRKAEAQIFLPTLERKQPETVAEDLERRQA